MVERGGDDAGDVELRDTSIGSPGAAAGRNDLSLKEVDRFGDGGVVGVGMIARVPASETPHSTLADFGIENVRS